MASSPPSRQPSPQEQKFIDDILDLYKLKPNHQAYSHYRSDAVFHDPVSIAEGLDSIKSQFNGMPKLFAKSDTEHVAMLASSTATSLEIDLTQHYVFKSPLPGKSEGTAKTVNSKFTFRLDEQGKIKEHIEEWDHQENKTGENGFFGRMMEGRKKMGAKMIEKTVPSNRPSNDNNLNMVCDVSLFDLIEYLSRWLVTRRKAARG